MLWCWWKIINPADLMKNKGRVVSFDINKKRLENAGIRLKRAGVIMWREGLLIKNGL